MRLRAPQRGCFLLVLIVGAHLGLVSACQSHPPLVAETHYFRVHSDEPWCAGRGPQLDHSYERLAERLGIALGSEQVDYFHFSSWDRARESCGTSTRCASSRAVYSWQRIDYHELVHVLTRRYWGTAPRILEEGVAQAIACDLLPYGHEVVPTPEVIDWLTSDATFIGNGDHFKYDEAQSFVHFLIRRFGMDGFGRVYEDLDPNVSLDRANAVFIAELGIGLTSAVDEWVAAGRRPFQESCVHAVRCAAPTVSSAILDFEVDCAVPIRPLLDDHGSPFTFEVSDPTRAPLLRVHDPTGRAWIEASSGCGSPAPHLSTLPAGIRETLVREAGIETNGDHILIAQLPPGRYVGHVQTRAEDEPIDVTVARDDIGLSSTCDGSQLREIDSSIGELSLYLEEGTTWVRVASPDPLRLRVVFSYTEEREPMVEAVEVCRSRCDGDCVEVTDNSAIDLDPGEVLFLGFRSTMDFAQVTIAVEG